MRVRLPVLGALAALGLALAVPLAHRTPALASPGDGPPEGPATVLETADAGGYTYLRVDLAGREAWIAAPHADVEVGAAVVVPAGLLMEDFRSEALDRTFDRIWFVDAVRTGDDPHAGHDHGPGEGHGASPHGASPHGGTPPAGMGASPHGAMGMDMGMGDRPSPDSIDLSGIEPLPDGHTVAQIWEKGADLAGGEVAFRGRVVKFLPGIMGRNWAHVRDGTGEAGTNDLTVTTDAMVSVGDLVIVKGALAADVDFGSGYRYDLIVQEATLTVQSES